jgi:hypothetical protein
VQCQGHGARGGLRGQRIERDHARQQVSAGIDQSMAGSFGDDRAGGGNGQYRPAQGCTAASPLVLLRREIEVHSRCALRWAGPAGVIEQRPQTIGSRHQVLR